MAVAGSSVTTSHGSQMTNYARIGHAAQKLFPEILQELMVLKEPQNILCGDVKSNRYLSRNLRADEWVMVNNVRTNGYNNFDVALILKLVRNLELVSAPTQDWDYPASPTTTEILPGDDIERIRRIRNKILHRGNTSVPDEELAGYFQAFKDIAERLETFLGKRKGEFVTRFEVLESCCMDEKTEKEYLERLQKLSEREDNMAEVVNNLRNDVDKIKYKDFHKLHIETWEEQNMFFVETKAAEFVLHTLKDNANCTVTGSSGMGKSATIHHVALYLRDTQGYYIIPCHGPFDIENYFLKGKKQVFVIDDACGRYTAIQSDIEEWLKHSTSINLILKTGNVKLLSSCRLQVFNEAQFKRIEYFVKHSCDLSEGKFHLTKELKVQIALQYLPEDVVNTIKDDFDEYEFLPLMFTLFKSLRETNISIDPKSYFKNPFERYADEISELKKLHDKTKYCALFMLVINNGSMDASDFMSEEQEKDKKKRKLIFECCGIPRSTLRERIIEQLESLVNLFVKRVSSNSNTKLYTTLHDKLFDYLCYYFGMNMQIDFIRFADVGVLEERSKLIEYNLELPNNSVVEKKDFEIVIDKENENKYFERIAHELMCGDYIKIFNSTKMECEKFRLRLLNSISKLMINFDVTSDRMQALLEEASKGGHYEIVEFLIEKGVIINIANCDGDSPLVLASWFGKNKIVKLLIDKGANVNVYGSRGYTPLLLACISNNYDIVKSLLDKGANVNCEYGDGTTPLIAGCADSYLEIVKLLIDNGANVDAADSNGDTPLIWSCRQKCFEIIELLLVNNANVNVANSSDESPLYLACEMKNNEIVRLILDRDANVNSNGRNGDTPLIWACRENNEEIIKLLIDKGANVNYVDRNGDTALIWACFFDNGEVVRLLLERGANVNYCYDTDGVNPLTFACQMNSNNVVEYLIDNNADVNAIDEDGMSALMYACKLDNNDIVNVLIKSGAKTSAKNHVGKTVEMFAMESENKQTIQLIRDSNHEEPEPRKSIEIIYKRKQDTELFENQEKKQKNE